MNFEKYRDEISKKLVIINNFESIHDYLANQNFIMIFRILEKESALFFIDEFNFLREEIEKTICKITREDIVTPAQSQMQPPQQEEGAEPPVNMPGATDALSQQLMQM